MSTVLFEARPYDPRRERRKRLIIGAVIIGAILLAAFLWWNRNWPYERRVGRFFAALQAQNYETAYAIWMNDPEWKQHADRYSRYTLGEFKNDWGSGGEWGIIKTYRVIGSVDPGKTGYNPATGVVVAVEVNGRVDKACVWVEKSDKTLSFSPYECR